MTIRSANTLLTLTLSAATHPDKVAKAQEELDRVVGQDRLPEYADVEQLPYVKAFIKEVMRWRPTAPGAFSSYVQRLVISTLTYWLYRLTVRRRQSACRDQGRVLQGLQDPGWQLHCRQYLVRARQCSAPDA